MILSAAIMVSAATVAGYAEEADSKSKITDTLSQKIEEDFFDGEITAVLNIKITDDVTFKTKYYTPFSSYLEEHSNDGLSENELYTKWLSEAYRFDSFKVGYELYLHDFVKRKGIEEYLPQFIYGDMFPSIYVKLPQKEFYELIKDDEIFRVDYWNTTLGILPDVGYWFSYSSDDALRILRASVGLEEKHWSKLYDVNGDKKIDSSDALLALRESVRLEMVFEGYKAKLFPLYNVEKYGYIDERYQIAYYI